MQAYIIFYLLSGFLGGSKVFTLKYMYKPFLSWLPMQKLIARTSEVTLTLCIALVSPAQRNIMAHLSFRSWPLRSCNSLWHWIVRPLYGRFNVWLTEKNKPQAHSSGRWLGSQPIEMQVHHKMPVHAMTAYSLKCKEVSQIEALFRLNSSIDFLMSFNRKYTIMEIMRFKSQEVDLLNSSISSSCLPYYVYQNGAEALVQQLNPPICQKINIYIFIKLALEDTNCETGITLHASMFQKGISQWLLFLDIAFSGRLL